VHPVTCAQRKVLVRLRTRALAAALNSGFGGGAGLQHVTISGVAPDYARRSDCVAPGHCLMRLRSALRRPRKPVMRVEHTYCAIDPGLRKANLGTIQDSQAAAGCSLLFLPTSREGVRALLASDPQDLPANAPTRFSSQHLGSRPKDPWPSAVRCLAWRTEWAEPY